jgi:signal transduction histidine kinase
MRTLFKKAPAAKEPFDINETVQEVLALTQTELQRNRVSVQTQFASGLHILTGDRIQLQQVILNLVVNAIEAMSAVAEGPRELGISSLKVPDIAGAAGVDEVEGSALTDSAYVLQFEIRGQDWTRHNCSMFSRPTIQPNRKGWAWAWR